MPELPDVESFKKYFDSRALHHKISHVDVPDRSILKVSPETLKKNFEGKEFKSSRRIGKNLLVDSGKHWLVLHFGMTGYLEYYKENGEPPKYSKALFHFDNDHCLSVINKRKLGSIDVITDIDKWRKSKDIGPDALELDEGEFRDILLKRKSKVKTALTDQSAMAGIGNIYADEILFQAGLHPEKSVSDLSGKQIKELYNKMKEVLETAIDHDAVPGDLPSDYLITHRKEGDDCPRCGGEIEKITISGRSSYVCPQCQK